MNRISTSVANLAGKAVKGGRSIMYNPRLSLSGEHDLIRLGTEYGGWVLQDSPGLRGCTIISAGLGEDASFDVEFASRFGARVLVVDPTPRAMEHFRGLSDRVGRRAERPYTSNGQIPVDAYDLSSIVSGQLELIDRALTDTPGPVRFFSPPDPAHVSYSIVNFQNGYSLDTPHIVVEGVMIDELWERAGGDVPLVKLDIEGAEIETILDMLNKGLIPQQLLVEFDELNFPSRRAKDRFHQVHRALAECGLHPVHREGRANFLFLRA